MAYRSRAVVDPRGVMREFGLELARLNVEVRVLDSTADLRYLVLPRRPEGTEGMSESELAELGYPRQHDWGNGGADARTGRG